MHAVPSSEVCRVPERVRSVDYAKSLAIISVILIHASSDVLRYGWIGSGAWLSGLFWGSISRGAVPLFLLCSGALLLDTQRELSIGRIWRRNIPHLMLALFVWAAFYKAIPFAAHGIPDGAAVRDAISSLLRWQHEGHLYYLPMMLLVYAALPITRTFTAHADGKTLRYFLGFWSICGIVLPTLSRFGVLKGFGGVVQQWPLPMVWAAIGYTVLGHALRLRPLGTRSAAVLFAAGSAVCFGGTWLLSAQAGTLQTQLLEGFSPGPCLMAAGAFSLCCQAAEALPRCSTAAERLSRASFCIYLVHIAVLRVLNHVGLTTGLFTPLISVPVIALVCGGLSWFLYLLLSHIPWVSRWLI